MAKRVMSLWLPQLPLERRARLGDERLSGPFAIVREIKNAWRLTHINAPAQSAGLRPGLSIPDARAICPQLSTQPADAMREELMLRAIRRWADKLSPVAALDKPDGLYLDITGCAHLFGGEADMAAQTLAQFADMRLSVRIGVADTKGGARALSRFSSAAQAICPPGKLSAYIADLPVEALNLPDKTAQDLRRVGLKTIGQLYPIKPGELARRYGLDLPQSLSKALGRSPDPLTPHAIDPVYAARMNLPDPIGLKGDLDAVLARLSASVCSRLNADKKGARQFTLTVRCVDTGDHALTIGFARPCADQALITRQFERPLDQLKIKFGADWFRFLADRIEPVRERQHILGALQQDKEKNDNADALSQLVTTVGNRIGFDRVRRFLPFESHLPEREFITAEVADSPPPPVWPDSLRERPARIFCPERLHTLEPGRPPKRFEWRRKSYAALSAIGPERLSGEWWADERDILRDYWVVVTAQGPRLWLMTHPGHTEPNWFVAGRFL